MVSRCPNSYVGIAAPPADCQKHFNLFVHTMSHTSTPGAIPSSTTNPTVLWVAIGVLGAASLAMGSMLLRSNAPAGPVSSEPVALAAQVAHAAGPPPVINPEPARSVAATQSNPTANAKPATPKPPARAVEKAPMSPKAPEVTAQAPAVTPAATPAVVQRIPPPPACAVCGTVESVNATQSEPASGSGVGVIAGAAIGGLLGNQIGGGTGKDLATIAGMVGGGWAGNTVEKKMKRETVYEVGVRMEDGTLRRLEQKSSVAVGTRVTVEAGKLAPVVAAQ